jgi:hypothetical protein
LLNHSNKGSNRSCLWQLLFEPLFALLLYKLFGQSLGPAELPP